MQNKWVQGEALATIVNYYILKGDNALKTILSRSKYSNRTFIA